MDSLSNLKRSIYKQNNEYVYNEQGARRQVMTPKIFEEHTTISPILANVASSVRHTLVSKAFMALKVGRARHSQRIRGFGCKICGKEIGE